MLKSWLSNRISEKTTTTLFLSIIRLNYITSFTCEGTRVGFIYNFIGSTLRQMVPLSVRNYTRFG